LVAVGRAVTASHPSLSVGPAPAWVVAPMDPLREVEHGEEQSEDLDYLVSERQVRTRPQQAFVHFAYRVMAPAGLSSGAEFAVTFDPAYERVAFHHLRVIRDGKAEDRLDVGAFEILREERDRDRALYDGRLTAVHHLRDVRVGDIVHYAYTVTGSNPVFGDRYVDALYLGWGKPVRQFRYRILTPAEHAWPLVHRVRGESDWPPRTRVLPDGSREATWQRSPLPSLLGDPDRPGWHFFYPLLQLGEFANWSEVVEWGLPLYSGSAEHPALRAKTEELRAAAPDAAGRVLAALGFVQDEVRYLGIELGANSHRPSPPELTIERRFGDCKDKTLLLCTLLRGLGIEADPALVHSGHGRSFSTASARVASAGSAAGLHASLPTPLAFDHVIARVRLPDGTVVWLDPTRTHQTGPLAERTAGDFGQALVLRAGETGLTDMQRPAGAAGRLREKVEFTSRALDQPVEMDVTSIYEGDRATSMRAYLAGRTATQLTRDYLNYYLQKYPGITSRAAVSWTDDREHNQVRVREFYEVPDFWTLRDDGIWRAELHPHAISDLVRVPGSQSRTSPLALAHPNDVFVEVKINLHESWPVEAGEADFEDAFVRYTSTTLPLEQGIRLTYHYVTKSDHVPASDVAGHAAVLAKIRNDLTLTLTKNTKLGGGAGGASVEDETYRLNPWMVLLAALTVFVTGRLSWRVLRRGGGAPAADGPPPLPAEEGRPIGGWLLLVAFGVIARCFTVPISIVDGFENYFDLTLWNNLTATGSEARNIPLAVLIALELVGNLTLVVFVWLSALLFFMRRREAPRWQIIVLVFGSIYLLADTLAAWALVEPPKPEEWKPVIQALVGAMIWVPYFLSSVRVRETFVR
jgi:transglutaminase-like putative cysteine protease